MLSSRRGPNDLRIPESLSATAESRSAIICRYRNLIASLMKFVTLRKWRHRDFPGRIDLPE